MHIVTPFNVLYILLPLLETCKNNGYCTIHDILYNHSDNVPDIMDLTKMDEIEVLLEKICDHKEAGDSRFFKLNDEKAMLWIKGKVETILARMDNLESCHDTISKSSTDGNFHF